MRIIKIALYKHSKSLFWKWIRIKQNLQWFPWRYAKYSHIELVFEDWICFSSSEEDGGVRFKNIKFKKNHWDFINIPMSDYNYKKVLAFCEKEEWNNYNFTWIVFAQLFNLNIKWKWDWFCSEICSSALQEISMFCKESALFINPAKMAELLEENEFYIDKHLKK